MATIRAVDGPAADVNGIRAKEDDDDVVAFDREAAMTTGENLFRHDVELSIASEVPRSCIGGATKRVAGIYTPGLALTNASQVGRFTGTAD